MIKDGSNFLTLGPNAANQLLGVKMDTWFKWWVTAIYTFVSTAVAAFSSDALCPFFSNVIEDHKTQYIPYSKFKCLLMVQCFTIYGVIMSVIGMFVALTQVDFMIIRIVADLVVNSHTTYYFLRNKEVDVEQHAGTPCIKVPGSSTGSSVVMRLVHEPLATTTPNGAIPATGNPVSTFARPKRYPRLVVLHSTCPPLSPFPHANSFVLGRRAR